MELSSEATNARYQNGPGPSDEETKNLLPIQKLLLSLLHAQEILSHWRRCSYNECDICGPVRVLHEKYLDAIHPPLGIPLTKPFQEESFMRWQYPIPYQSTDLTVHKITPESVLDLNIKPIAYQNTNLGELDFRRRAQMIRSIDIMIYDVIDYASKYESRAFTEAFDLEQYNSMSIHFAAIGAAELAKENWVRKYDVPIEEPASSKSPVKLPPNASKKKKWPKKEIFDKFFPVLRALYHADEGNYFGCLMDYTSVKISDDLKAKAHRIDLSFIYKKLSTGAYANPWDLSFIFDFHADAIMREMGYCCGKYYSKHQVFRCNTGNACKIGADDVYLEYHNRDKRVLTRDLYRICYQCFENAGYTAVFTDGPGKPGVPIKKIDLMGPFSNKEKIDEWEVQCLECGRRFHLICVLYKKDIWPDGYICKLCTQKLGRPPVRNYLNAKNLPTNKLSDFLEKKVEDLLRERNINGGVVTIRVLSSTDKLLEVRPLMRHYLQFKGMPMGPFPYRQKTVFAFQEIDGQDVCFFAFYTQEHGLNAMFPNRGHVYLACIDSISWFRPEHARSCVSEAILIGYLQYIKNHGFVAVHVCTTPTNDRASEIFIGHPNDQVKPNRRTIRAWFTSMLQSARDGGIVEYVDDILDDAYIRGVERVTDLPYFDGDIWPEAIEFILTNARKTVKCMKQGDTNVLNRMFSSDPSALSSYAGRGISFDTITKSSLFETMKDFKRDFPVIYLRPRGCIQLISDPDELISGMLMQEREVFLKELKVRGIGFSTLREAKFATMSMLFGLHRENNNGDLYYCNICRSVITIRWKCNVCSDYYLCPDCYQTNTHPHFMLRYGLHSKKPNFILQPVSIGSYTLPPCFISDITHASRCQVINCQFASCAVTKLVYAHYATCLQRSCLLCQQIDECINAHVVQCTNPHCPVPFCKTCGSDPVIQPMGFTESVPTPEYATPMTCHSDSSEQCHQPANIEGYMEQETLVWNDPQLNEYA
ncbi:hypothetical protein Aperf_G00000027701 [Anoplocephala perfoliata]